MNLWPAPKSKIFCLHSFVCFYNFFMFIFCFVWPFFYFLFCKLKEIPGWTVEVIVADPKNEKKNED